VRPSRAALAAALACAAAGLLAPSGALAQHASSGCSKAPGAYRFYTRLTIDGVVRTALVNVPQTPRPPGTPLPLVLMFHGAGSNGAATESSTGITAAANRHSFIAVYPNANGKYWNLGGGGATGEDDVNFVSALLDRLDSTLCVNDDRIYATGGSNGGGFVARIGCELSDRIAAIAPVAGLYGRQPSCKPFRPIPVLEIHGTADQTVPYNGYGPNGQGSVWSFLVQWDQWDSCPSTPAVWRRLGPKVLFEGKSSCAGGTQVAHIKLIGEPHAWPKPVSSAGRGGSQGVSFDAAAAVMQFFDNGTVP